MNGMQPVDSLLEIFPSAIYGGGVGLAWFYLQPKAVHAREGRRLIWPLKEASGPNEYHHGLVSGRVFSSTASSSILFSRSTMRFGKLMGLGWVGCVT